MVFGIVEKQIVVIAGRIVQVWLTLALAISSSSVPSRKVFSKRFGDACQNIAYGQIDFRFFFISFCSLFGIYKFTIKAIVTGITKINTSFSRIDSFLPPTHG